MTLNHFNQLFLFLAYNHSSNHWDLLLTILNRLEAVEAAEVVVVVGVDEGKLITLKFLVVWSFLWKFENALDRLDHLDAWDVLQLYPIVQFLEVDERGNVFCIVVA